MGSEGALGVITEVTARVRPVPERRRYEAWMAADFESGAEIVRALAQADALPDVVRVSDQAETRISLALSGTAGAKRALLDGYLRLRRRAGGCVVICGWEGEREAVERRRALATRRLLRRGRGAPRAARRAAPGSGAATRARICATSCSTSATWPRRSRPPTPGARLGELYEAVGPAIARLARRPGDPRGRRCATSRTPTATAPRSTSPSWLAAEPGAELEQWRAVKTAACEAIVGRGGTITHHHGVGRDHLPYMRARDRRARDRGRCAPSRSASIRPGS